jgi:leishmanolysin
MNVTTQSYEKQGMSPLRIKFVPDFSKSCRYAGERISTYTPACGTATVSYTCTANDVMTAEKTQYWNTMSVGVSNYLIKTLSVIPVSNLHVSTSQCCRASISSSMQSHPGYDLVIYAHFMPLVGSVAAFAGPCATDSTGRPIAGFMNFSPKSMQTNQYSDNIHLFMHELTHVLGFTGGFLSRFPSMTATRVKADGRTVREVVSPTVKQKVREHFGCPTATGAEMEDWDSPSIPNHWEKSVFFSEYMTGILDENFQPVSPITLALLQDLGFYKVNFEMAEKFVAGKGAGCSWLNSRCDTRSGSNFCRTQNEPGCTYDHMAKGFCNKMTWSGTIPVTSYTSSSSLPQYFRYFGSANVGGGTAMSNFCPMITAYSNGDCTESQNFNPSIDNILGNQYGSYGRCFSSSVLSTQYWGGTLSNDGKTRCHTFTCKANGGVRIYIGAGTANWIDCPNKGAVVDVYKELSKLRPSCVDNGRGNCASFFGTITCPDPTIFCTPTSSRKIQTLTSNDSLQSTAGNSVGGSVKRAWETFAHKVGLSH